MRPFRVSSAFPRLICCPAVLMALAAPVRAQDTPAPPHLAIVEGAATLDRDGQPLPATVNMPLVPGDRLQTTSGRAEVLFADGSALDIDRHSVVALDDLTLIRLEEGRAILDLSAEGAESGYELDSPSSATQADRPGRYRAAYPEETAAPRVDAFEQWSASLHDARDTSRSAQYLPPNLQSYGQAFDQYGAWQYSAPYGYVWYPAVAPGWRPYYNGYWSPAQPYGWTWIGLDFWSWPTHHYGRWGSARGTWFWIPARTWAPAWVSWGAAPGYVSWCPLGFDNRPVFSLALGIGNAWDGWVVVPRTSFGLHGSSVNRYAVGRHELSRATPFIVQNAPPVAVPRHGARETRFVPRGPEQRRSDSTRGVRGLTGMPRAPEERRLDSTGDSRRRTVMPRAPDAAQPADEGRVPRPRAPEVMAPRYRAPVAVPRTSPEPQTPGPQGSPRTQPRTEPVRPIRPPAAAQAPAPVPQRGPERAVPSSPPAAPGPPPPQRGVPRTAPAPQAAPPPPSQAAPRGGDESRRAGAHRRR